MELRIFTGQDGSFIYYEDAGDGYDYEKGEFTTVTICWQEQSRKLVFGDRVGAYPGMKQKMKFKVVIVGQGKGCGLTETEEPSAIIDYDGIKQVAWLS
ncbi:hypothetical protein D3C80_2015580 [compost metagenome]